jgi:transcriptional regulator with XRE-family HTH domain
MTLVRKQGEKWKAKMTIAERVRDLRGDKTQADFAADLGVSQQQVSALEKGTDSPSADALVRLGNVSPYPDNVWFWKQAGLDSNKMVATAEQVLKDRGAAPTPGEIVRIPCSRKTVQREEPLDRFLQLPAESVPNLGSTRCLLIDETAASPSIPPDSLIVLDASQKDEKQLVSFWKQIVLVEFTPALKCAVSTTLLLGRLAFKRETERHHRPESLELPRWVATIGPLGDFAREWEQGDKESVRVGGWDAFEQDNREPSRSQTPDSLEYRRLSYNYQTHGQERDKEEALKVFDRLCKQAPSHVRLDPGYRMLGRVIAWFQPR